MTWELCDGTSHNLVDMWGGCDNNMSYRKARQHFIEKGYEGKYILIAIDYARPPFAPFKIYNVNLRPRDKHTC